MESPRDQKRMFYGLRLFVLAVAFGLAAGCSSSNQNPSEKNDISQVLERSEADLIFVAGGQFKLGDIGNDSGGAFVPLQQNNKPPTAVVLDGFSIQSKEVTWADFLAYLHDVDRDEIYTVESGFKNAVRIPIVANNDPLSPNFAEKPARSPNYSEAENYCEWLADKTGHPYALPTEAQWEYAARNRGKSIAYATNNGKLEIDTYLQRSPVDPLVPVKGNVLIHSSFETERRPVGSYPPNPLGIHDMTGNVPEWTRDWYYPGFGHLDRVNPVADDPNESEPDKKAVRDLAGYGDHSGGLATVYARRAVSVDSPNQGFRCVVNHPEPIN
ncbi:formylglycine-generating enzyme family protein [Marinobacter sp.]|uniref:formylglycine-generating enzyme family protein n=1 Tax=Marinobacter sp. TaxID=50741 RepID=UPI0035C6A642